MAAVLGSIGRRFDKGVINGEQLKLALLEYLADDLSSAQRPLVPSWCSCPLSWVLVPRGAESRASLAALAMDIQRNISGCSKGVAEHFGMAVKLSKKLLPQRFNKGMRDLHRAYVFARHHPCAEIPKAVPGLAFFNRWKHALNEAMSCPRWVPKPAMPAEKVQSIFLQQVLSDHGSIRDAVDTASLETEIIVVTNEGVSRVAGSSPSSHGHGNQNVISRLSTSDLEDMRDSAEHGDHRDPYDNISSSTFLALRGDFDDTMCVDENLTLSDLEDMRDAAEDFHQRYPPLLCDDDVPVPPPGARYQPCKNFMIGKCLWGDECWFRHDGVLQERDLTGAYADLNFVGQDREPHGLEGIPSFSYPALLGEGSWIEDGDDLLNETVTLARLSNGTFNNRLAKVTMYSTEKGRYGVLPYGSTSSIWVRPHNVFYPAFCPGCESLCSGPNCYACGDGQEWHSNPSWSSEG